MGRIYTKCESCGYPELNTEKKCGECDYIFTKSHIQIQKTEINDIVKSLKNIREYRKKAKIDFDEKMNTAEREEKYFLMMLSQMENQN